MKNKFKKIALLLTAPLAMAVFTSLRCPEEDPVDFTVLLPNPDDCNSFFMCSNGVPILQRCPEGLWFNSKSWLCDFPMNLDQEAREACGASGTGGNGSGSCTASLSCSLGSANDYVRCSGTECHRNPVERYVECDKVKTYCDR